MVDLLVVAGEASGDRAAAGVLTELAATLPVRASGMGGPALAAAGATLVCDLRATTAMGVTEVAARSVGIALAHRRLLHATRRKPRAALLVNYTEFNVRLAHLLHARGIPVLWYGAPQIWAWRPGRARSIRPAIDRLAVMLPFEEGLWRRHGVDAHYVGHPALEVRGRGREEARMMLGLTARAETVAILPGSRPHEVRRLLGPMLDAYERVRRDRASVDGRVLLASSLDESTRRHAVALAEAYRVPVHPADARLGASVVLPAFDAAICASGTASLEATLARAIPVVAYRVGLAAELAARHLMTTRYVALPNVLLGRAAFPELLQRQARPARIAVALARVLESRAKMLAACAEVEAVLGPRRTPSREVARMLLPWLTGPGRFGQAHPPMQPVAAW